MSQNITAHTTYGGEHFIRARKFVDMIYTGNRNPRDRFLKAPRRRNLSSFEPDTLALEIPMINIPGIGLF